METNLEENKKIADLLFPGIASGHQHDRAYFESLYLNEEVLKAQRPRENGQEYLRLAPSPTGELHAGALYLATISDIVAHKNVGKLIIRIEDTDKVREVEGAKERMVKYLSYFNIKIDEGLILENINGVSDEVISDFNLTEIGNYGPYVQSQRTHIYNAFLYDFILKGFAYPCFMTSDELDAMREEQTVMKTRPGVYGKYANSKDMTYDEVKNKIEQKDKNGESQKYVIRLNSNGDFSKKRKFNDEIMGDLELSENDEHFVIAKGDGVPTYHFAHLIDDYTMGITYVIRANEWVASITKHLELWDKLGAQPIKYGHIMPINKKDGNSVRKLSKRKDPEASVSYYLEQGYTVDAVKSYLMRLANPSFDAWWDTEVTQAAKENREINYVNYISYFNFDELKRNSRGPLLDFDKLNNISADIVGSMSAKDVSEKILNWSKINDIEFFNIISKDKNYLEKVLNIERAGETKRKDIYNWSVAKSNIFYMWDELYVSGDIEESKKEILSEIEKNINEDKYFDMSIDIPEWIRCFKEICINNEILNKYKFGEIMMVLRQKITGLEKTPNLYFIFNVLGKDRVLYRLSK